jgi:hypothetical protein
MNDLTKIEVNYDLCYEFGLIVRIVLSQEISSKFDSFRRLFVIF